LPPFLLFRQASARPETGMSGCACAGLRHKIATFRASV
jgi:hypothetical protein